MPPKPCLVCGTPTTNGPRCPEHTRTTTQRGYGYTHQRQRLAWKAEVEAGVVNCARCGQPIAPDASWHLDHTDDRSDYLGPSHDDCNVKAGNQPQFF